ncbi:unnamed protein product [Polarella glacialis]|uniref:Palmitoyltransferase n=1 Tax=Polarella glacialis TaxID=89957 RepID=A0A813DIC8_POLGL|nr:unnamed protein product [Polarella glacialis]
MYWAADTVRNYQSNTMVMLVPWRRDDHLNQGCKAADASCFFSGSQASNGFRLLPEPMALEVSVWKHELPFRSMGHIELDLGALWSKALPSDVQRLARRSVDSGAERLNASGELNPRVYEVWPHVGGRNRFFCGGRCVSGPTIDRWYNLCAWTFILMPSGLFFFVYAGQLWHHYMWLPILTALVLLSTIIFLLLTSCTDPGILPRRELQEALPGLEEEVCVTAGTGPVLLDSLTAEPLCAIAERQEAEGYRWCSTCGVVRPPRCSHCSDCDNCVMTFDHHCPFVNNCVGHRNYAFFQAFLVSTFCLGFSVAAGIGLCVAEQSSYSSPLSLDDSPLLVLVLLLIAVPTAVMLLGVLGLSCFHAWLACRGKTTKEVFTGRVTVGGRTLFHLRGPSLIHARARVSFPIVAV